MDLLQLFTLFPNQQACLQHLEDIRFGDTPYCPHCNSTYVARKSDARRIGRWNCHNCTSSFNVLSGTVFEKTRVPLQKWFLAIHLMAVSRKNLSSSQLARMLILTQPTALRMQNRIRSELSRPKSAIRLHTIVEAAEVLARKHPLKHKFLGPRRS